MKNTLYLLIGLLIVIGCLYLFWNAPAPSYVKPIEIVKSDYKKIPYLISGQSITLGDGIFNYFGNEIKTDLNSDGREDRVFLITQKIDTGVRYFIIGALDTPQGLVGLNGMMIGDNIAPQTTEVSREAGKEGQIIVNYAVRNPGETLSVQPSQGKSMWIKYDSKNMGFGEVVQNFEGESR